METASATPAVIFILVCSVLFVVAKAAGYKGDAYEFRMTGLKIFGIIMAIFLGLMGLGFLIKALLGN